MSTREQAQNILNSLSEEQLAAFVTLFGRINSSGEKPNVQTLEAMQELENGGGTLFKGTTEELFSKLLEDQ